MDLTDFTISVSQGSATCDYVVSEHYCEETRLPPQRQFLCLEMGFVLLPWAEASDASVSLIGMSVSGGVKMMQLR